MSVAPTIGAPAAATGALQAALSAPADQDALAGCATQFLFTQTMLTEVLLLAAFGSPWSGFGTERIIEGLCGQVEASAHEANAHGLLPAAGGDVISQEEMLALTIAAGTFGSPWGGLGGIGRSEAEAGLGLPGGAEGRNRGEDRT